MDDSGFSSSTASSDRGPRTQTVAFRLTAAERERIDLLAAGGRISTSEFARQSVMGGVAACTHALDNARTLGRDEMRGQIAELEQELAQARSHLSESRQRSYELSAQLARAPDELLAAARQLVAGADDSQVTLAMCWSRIHYDDRLKALPIVVTSVAHETDRAIAGLRVDEDHIDWGFGLVSRLEWLMEAMTPDSGRWSAAIDRSPRPEWAPLQTSRNRAVDSLCRLGERLAQREARLA